MIEECLNKQKITVAKIEDDSQINAKAKHSGYDLPLYEFKISYSEKSKKFRAYFRDSTPPYIDFTPENIKFSNGKRILLCPDSQ